MKYLKIWMVAKSIGHEVLIATRDGSGRESGGSFGPGYRAELGSKAVAKFGSLCPPIGYSYSDHFMVRVRNKSDSPQLARSVRNQIRSRSHQA
jgi:hypothetical protein